MNSLRTGERRRRLSARGVVLALSLGGSGMLAACSSGDVTPTAAWCGFVLESAGATGFPSVGDDPAEAEALILQLDSFATRLPQVAPDEIATDAAVVGAGIQTVVDAFVAADFDAVDVASPSPDPALIAAQSAAIDSLESFTAITCGRSLGVSDDFVGDAEISEALDDSPRPSDEPRDVETSTGTESEGGELLGDSTLRDVIAAEFESMGLDPDEAGCVADNIDFDTPASDDGNDLGPMLEIFELCDIGLDRLAEIGENADVVPDGGLGVGDGPLRDAMVAEFQALGLDADEAGCVADNMNIDDPAVQNGDIDAMFDLFEICEIGLDRLVEIGE